jgi:apolipoprotein D and lipocalin family protein
MILSILFAVLISATMVSAEPGLVGACRNKTIDTVHGFVPANYLGMWYEIGHSKSFYFDHGCQKTFAQYKPMSQDSIYVNNTCLRDGIWKSAIGKAHVVGDGKLEVSFFGPFEAPYDVVYLEKDYSVSLVVSCTEAGGSNLWVLSREPEMEDASLNGYLEIFRKQGFVADDFTRTVQ